MAMSTAAKVALGVGVGGGLLALLSAGGGKQSGPAPQRVPSVPPDKPATPKGEQRNNDQGRTWDTFYVNRDERKHYEMRVFSVASAPSQSAIGTGTAVVDTYETVVGNADWQWQGQACNGVRWLLKFQSGHLVSYTLDGYKPPCLTIRPMWEIYARSLKWIQIGSNVLLVLDTNSGLNRRSPDKLLKSASHKPGKFGGTGAYFGERDNPEWYNGNVSSGYVTLDASWIFNPKGPS